MKADLHFHMMICVLALLFLGGGADAQNRNLAPEAVLNGPNAVGNLVNLETDGDGSYSIDYNPNGVSCSVSFEWNQAMELSQFVLYKKLGRTPAGYTVPAATRLLAINTSTGAIEQKLYYVENETGIWGVKENPVLKKLTVDFNPPILLQDDQKLQMNCWIADPVDPNRSDWILMDEVEIFGKEFVGCGDPSTVYLDYDLNKDCMINLLDYAMLAANYNQCTDPCNTNCDPYWDSQWDPNKLPDGF